MGIRNILFDLDGTLSDSAPGITKSAAYALDRFGIPHDGPDSLIWLIGPPLAESFVKTGIPEEKAFEAVEVYREYYTDKGILDNELYPGTAEALASLSKRYRLFLATSKPRVQAERILKRCGIFHYFEFVGGAELDGTRTRKAEVMAWVIDTCGLDPTECVMVGDRYADRDGAAELGIPFIGAGYGYGSPEELGGAVAVIDGICDLCRVLEKLRDR